jgi:hypothetical protein
MSSDTVRALHAYAEPLEANAREFATGVLDSIECDLAHGVSVTFMAEVRDVKPAEEWRGALSSMATPPPRGALPWAQRIWENAFYKALHEQAEVRAQEHMRRGERLIREHLRRDQAPRDEDRT